MPLSLTAPVAVMWALPMVAEVPATAAFCAVILPETSIVPSLALSVPLALLAFDMAGEEPEFLLFEADVVLVAEVPSLPPTDRLLPAKLLALPDESEVLSSSLPLPVRSAPVPIEYTEPPADKAIVDAAALTAVESMALLAT